MRTKLQADLDAVEASIGNTGARSNEGRVIAVVGKPRAE
jgi:hypothetical protein